MCIPHAFYLRFIYEKWSTFQIEMFWKIDQLFSKMYVSVLGYALNFLHLEFAWIGIFIEFTAGFLAN